MKALLKIMGRAFYFINMLTLFKIGESIGQISGLTILVKLSFSENNIQNLVAEFEGDDLIGVFIGSSIQESKVTTNDFSTPLVYSVTDISGNLDYTVTVVNIDAKILDINFPNLLCSIQINNSDNNIKVVCPENTLVSNLLVNIYPSINATLSTISGSYINLSNPINLIVTSEAGNSNTYNLSVVNAVVHNYYGEAIFNMLLNRLPFIEDTPTNRSIIGELTYEIMYENEDCFGVAVVGDIVDDSRIGNEMFYNTLYKSIVADILAVNLLINKSLKTVGGEASTNTIPTDKYLKTVEAGSVKVGYDQISIKDKTVIALDTTTLIAKFESEVKRKMSKLGCYYGEVEQDLTVPYVGFIASGIAKNIV